MQKNKRWLVLPLLIILILPIFCVPAMAVSLDTDVKFSPVFWDVVQTGDQMVEFAGNVVSDERDVTVSSPVVTQVVTANTSNMTAEVEFHSDYSSRTLYLSATSFILKASDFDSLFFTTFNETNSLRVSWSVNVIEWSLYNDKWVPSVSFVSGSSDASLGVEVAPLILRDLKRSVADSRFYFIQSMVVQVFVQGDEFYDDYVVMRYNLADNFDNFTGYGLSLDLPYKTEVVVDPANPNDVSFVDWLQVAVGGFLDFQLWPGFTLNQLIEFVVVIGLVLWFITLMI